MKPRDVIAHEWKKVAGRKRTMIEWMDFLTADIIYHIIKYADQIDKDRKALESRVESLEAELKELKTPTDTLAQNEWIAPPELDRS